MKKRRLRAPFLLWLSGFPVICLVFPHLHSDSHWPLRLPQATDLGTEKGPEMLYRRLYRR